MSCADLFGRVRARLDELGVQATFGTGRPVIECWDVWEVQDTIGRSIPDTLRLFYLEMGDGLTFRWQAPGEDENGPFAKLEIPSLRSLGWAYHAWRDVVLYTPEKAESYGFPHTEDPALAKRTAGRMWDWIPVLAEGNGDTICIDLGSPSAPVIFHKHDWLDGGTGDNGFLMAESWGAFLSGWAGVCFQRPRSMFWASALGPSGVEWGGEQFREPFRLPPVPGPARPVPQSRHPGL